MRHNRTDEGSPTHTNRGVHGTPEPYWPADMTVDPKTNLMYIADGYGNRRVLIVDAATGKYVGHFGAYGQNPVMGENGGGPDVGEGVSSWPQPTASRPRPHRSGRSQFGEKYIPPVAPPSRPSRRLRQLGGTIRPLPQPP